MGVHSLEEWAELYKKKTNNDFKPHPNFRLIFFPERGFCEVSFEPRTRMVMAYQLCGDGRFWKRVLDALAMAAGYEHCGAICIRHIKPYIRFFGFHIVHTEPLPDGTCIYYGENSEGAACRCSPAWKDENGYAYYVTWEIV